MLKKTVKILSPIIAMLFLLIAVYALYNQLQAHSLAEIIQIIVNIPIHRILIASSLVFLSYFILTCYDYVGLLFMQKPMSYKRITFTSFLSYVFSLNVGMPVLTGGVVRIKYYYNWGLTMIEIAELMAFITLTFFIGFFNVTGLSLIINPIKIPAVFNLPIENTRLFGIIIFSILSIYILFCLFEKGSISLFGKTFRFPSKKIMLMQVLTGSMDFIVLGTIFYVLLPAGIGLSYFQFIIYFLLAQVSGIVSNVPGGIGVFDTIMISLLSPSIPSSTIFGTLLVYRLIYYIIPLIFGLIIAGVYEARSFFRRDSSN